MAKRKKRSKKKERTIRVILSPRRFDLLISRFGKRFRKLAEQVKKTEKARFGKLSSLRRIITEEKMRMLREIKESSPDSIYELAKSLKRDIKSVREDLKQLASIGFVKLKRLKTKKKIKKTKPILAIERLNVIIEFT